MRVLLLLAPLTQLNAPYPSIMQLAGALRRDGTEVFQADLSLALALRLFSKAGMEGVTQELKGKRSASVSVSHFLAENRRYVSCVDAVLRFLQGKDPTLAYRIVTREFLPEGPRFRALENEGGESFSRTEQLFGALGVQDQAKYLASLFVDDLADVIRDGVDERFALSRYAEKIAASAASFDLLERELKASRTLVDRYLDELTFEVVSANKPDLVGVSAPFAGNVYGAFRIAQLIRERFPSVKTVLGGGYVNTELRKLSEKRVFDYFDFVALDDGEAPLGAIVEHLAGKRPAENLVRTFVRDQDRVVLHRGEEVTSCHSDVAPSYEGLPLADYFSLLEMPNPMHRLWSDGRWNKLALAHGCYWRKCSFCDLSLDYISRYDPADADVLVDHIEAIQRETGQSGFHFVDEAAPPALLKALAKKLIERDIQITWWGNLRFEKTFTPELTRLLARSGCIAVTGGLEVASDRLLKLMQKGVTIEQVARVTRAFADSGVMVHAYLMYGFPTETEQETVDSLEVVRQLFEMGCIQSAFWHRFSATVHSPVGRHPERYGIRITTDISKARFALNDLEFEDPTGCDHEALGSGLQRAVYNYMQGAGLDLDVRFWFEGRVPKAKVARSRIKRALISERT